MNKAIGSIRITYEIDCICVNSCTWTVVDWLYTNSKFRIESPDLYSRISFSGIPLLVLEKEFFNTFHIQHGFDYLLMGFESLTDYIQSINGLVVESEKVRFKLPDTEEFYRNFYSSKKLLTIDEELVFLKKLGKHTYSIKLIEENEKIKEPARGD
eukprot:UN26140